MKKYNCNIVEYTHSSIITKIPLDPFDYLDCATLEDLKESVLDTVAVRRRSINMIMDTEVSNDFELPKEFITAWQEAKEGWNREFKFTINCPISGKLDRNINVIPNDFLDCNDEQSLRKNVIKYLKTCINTGDFQDVYIDWNTVKLPVEFVKHWNKLKDIVNNF